MVPLTECLHMCGNEKKNNIFTLLINVYGFDKREREIFHARNELISGESVKKMK